MKSTLPFILSSLCFVALATPISGQIGASSGSAQPSLRIFTQWKLSEAGSWGRLHLDESSNLLYIPRTGYVAVVDTNTGKEVGKIEGFVDARAVALDDKGKFGYATDMTLGSTGFVHVFDRSTFKVIATVTVGRIPSAIIFDPVTRLVFAFSTGERNVAIIDPSSNTVAQTIPLPGKPHLALTDGKGSIYVSFRGIGKLVRIDTASRALSATWSTEPCAEFHGLTYDGEHRLLIGTCYPRQMIVVSSVTGKVTLAGESAIDAGDLALDAKDRLLFSGSSTGMLRVYRQQSPFKYTPAEELPTAPRAGTILFDPEKQRVYAVTSAFGPAPVSSPGLDETEAHLVPVAGTFRVLVVGP